MKEPLPSGKKRSAKLESLSDLERALTESKETAAAVRPRVSSALFWGRAVFYPSGLRRDSSMLSRIT